MYHDYDLYHHYESDIIWVKIENGTKIEIPFRKLYQDNFSSLKLTRAVN